MAYRPGELDQRIKIMRQTETPDGYGGNTIAWVEQFEIWAKVRPLSGSELTDYDRVNAEAKYIFIIRYPINVLDSDRIDWDGEGYNIRVRKKPTGRSLYMQIEAERGVAQ